MTISYGLFTVYILVACLAGAGAGAWIVTLFSGAQVTSLQDQLNTKATLWCKGCDYFKRNADLQDKLSSREAYVKTLEERCVELIKSNRALGVNLQRKTWRVA